MSENMMNLEERDVHDFSKEAYLNYAMYVIQEEPCPLLLMA